MCGIHLVLSKSVSDLDLMPAMLQNAKHRGPDGQHFVSGKIDKLHYALGHNLLSVVDDVIQPIENEHYALSFNGEIYNYKALAKKYKIVDFRNDAHILFQLLSLVGTQCLGELNGMFALVWIDKKNNRILLARDSFGQKPLYYSCQKARFIVSSLLSNTISNQSISKKSVRDILRFKASFYPIWEGVKELKKGSYMFVNKQLEITICPIVSDTLKTTNLETSLAQSIERHSSQSANAVLYSGGLDSSILLYELQQQNQKSIAYTLDVPTANALKTEQQNGIVFCKKIGVEQQLIKSQKADFEQFVSEIEQPVGDGAFYLQWLLAKEIKRNHNYALTGNGADELFAGYRRHAAFDAYLRLKPLLLLAKAFKNYFPTKQIIECNHLINSVLDKTNKANFQTFINFTSSQLLDSKRVQSKSYFGLEEALAYDLNHYLSADLLSIADQSGMAHGVEFRSPFLDLEMVQIAQTLDSNQKLKNKGKFHLKQLYANHPVFLPIINQKKQGFGVPFLQFWGDAMKNQLMDQLVFLKPFVSNTELQKITFLVHSWSDKWSNDYWNLLILTSWLKQKTN